jgi:hypothetical protein
MKRKLQIGELAVASFSTAEEGRARERGTVHGAAWDSDASCVVPETCASPCGEVATRGTCYHTCAVTCQGRTCGGSCPVCP